MKDPQALQASAKQPTQMLAAAPPLPPGQGQKQSWERSNIKRGTQSQQAKFLLSSQQRVISALLRAVFTL